MNAVSDELPGQVNSDVTEWLQGARPLLPGAGSSELKHLSENGLALRTMLA